MNAANSSRTLHPDFVQRYAILAADEAAKEGKKDPKKASTIMMARLVKEKVPILRRIRSELVRASTDTQPYTQPIGAHLLLLVRLSRQHDARLDNLPEPILSEHTQRIY